MKKVLIVLVLGFFGTNNISFGQKIIFKELLTFFQKGDDKNIIEVLRNRDYNIEPEKKTNDKIYNSVRTCYYSGKGEILKMKYLTISKTDGIFQGISYYKIESKGKNYKRYQFIFLKDEAK